MVAIKVFLLITVWVMIDFAIAGHHHVYHRIHVPTKIKTIYHTKIIKVPEHHHHHIEKEKIIKVPEHHHYIHEKEKDKFEPSSVDHHLHDSFGGGHDDFSGYESKKSYNYEDAHNIRKKHTPSRIPKRKTTKSTKSPESSKRTKAHQPPRQRKSATS